MRLTAAWTISAIAAIAAVRTVTMGASVAQTPTPVNPPTGLIVGHVVDGTSNAAVANAIVTLTGRGVTTRRVIVDPQGRFMFGELPPGAFTISSTKTGYLDGAYGKLRPDGPDRPLDLRDGERVIDATVRMWRFATMSGTVTDDVGDPVSGASVQMWRRAITAGRWRLTNTGRTGSTDERGEYRVIGLPPGEYAAVITSFTSSIPVSFLVATSASKGLEGAALSDFTRTTQTNGTSGYVSDLSQGFAAVRLGDMLLQANGPGVAPTVGDGHAVNVYPTVWYPSASTPAQATLITLGPGDHREGVDLRMTLTATMRISGTAIGSEGPVPYLALRLVPAALDDVAAELSTSLSQSMNTGTAATDSNGTFTFLAVPPGQYIIRALTTPQPPPEPAAAATVIHTSNGMSQTVSSGPPMAPMLSQEPSLWTAVPVSVADKDVTGVSVTLMPGLHVAGRVEFDGTATKPTGNSLRAIRVSLQPADGRTVWGPNGFPAQVTPEASFYSSGMMAGSYVLRVDSAPSGWSVKSAIVGGRDILDTAVVLGDHDVPGVVLTFTDHPSRLGGTVLDGQGRADANAAVLIFPSDGAWINLGAGARRLASARTSPTGAYGVSGLPPGAYDVVAVGDEMSANWQDPAFLQKLTRLATHVTLGDGQSLTVDLTTKVVR